MSAAELLRLTGVVADPLDKSNAKSAEEWFRDWAEPAARQRCWPLAIEYYTNAIQTAQYAPHNTDAKFQQNAEDRQTSRLGLYYFRRASAYEADADRKDHLLLALGDCNYAAKLQTKNAASTLQRVRLLLKLRRYSESIEEALTVLNGWPDCIPALRMLIDAKISSHDFSGSLEFIDRLIAAEPDNYEPQWILARALRKMRGLAASEMHGSREREVAALDKAISLINRFRPITSTHPPGVGRTHQPPFLVELRYERAVALIGTDKNDEAIRELSLLENMRMPSAEFYTHLSQAHLASNQPQNAQNALAAARKFAF